MRTLFSRPMCAILALSAAVLAQAQDLHIKKNITVEGNFVSTTETSIKGARERTVSQLPTGTMITLRQCDLKRTVSINEQSQTYLLANDAQDDAAVKAAAMVSGAPDSNAGSGAYVTETAAVTDTGERKTMYGYPARRLKMKVTVVSSPNSCSQLNQQYEVDGWYADIAKDMTGACQHFLPPIRQNEGCSDRVIRKRSGSAKPGYPLVENLTLHNADGSASEIGVLTSEITKPTLEKELFEVPAGFREVKTAAELNGTLASPAQSMNAAYSAPAQQPTPASAGATFNKTNALNAMFNPAAAMSMNRQAMAMAQQVGSSGAGNMMNAGGLPKGAAAAAGPTAVGPKPAGKIRIGIAPPDAQVGQGNNSNGDYSTPIRNAEVALMSGPAIDVVPLDSHIAMQLQAEAQQKQCDYVLTSGVVVKHAAASGFGKWAKFGGMAASMTPMGAMAHGMGGAMAAQAAGMAASQMAQKEAMNQLANFNGQIKSKDDVTVQYQLIGMGQTAPVLQNNLQGKAKADGEDVLTPLLQQTAEAVLTQVSKK